MNDFEPAENGPLLGGELRNFALQERPLSHVVPTTSR